MRYWREQRLVPPNLILRPRTHQRRSSSYTFRSQRSRRHPSSGPSHQQRATDIPSVQTTSACAKWSVKPTPTTFCTASAKDKTVLRTFGVIAPAEFGKKPVEFYFYISWTAPL